MKPKKSGAFSAFSNKAARAMGSPKAFIVAMGVVILWAILGPAFGFSDTWQLVINTGTTIVTFLMVFIIQNSQNRDSAAIQIKLDELIRVVEGAHNALLDLEELDVETQEAIRGRYRVLAKDARAKFDLKQIEAAEAPRAPVESQKITSKQ